MSNIAICHPNRLLELNKLHKVNWVDNANLPLENIQTTILQETARTSDFGSYSTKKCAFAISLKSLPYRYMGAIALVNHNLSTSAKFRATIFNEPAISYCSNVTFLPSGSFSATLDAGLGLSSSNKLKLFGFNKTATDNIVDGKYIVVNVMTYNNSTGALTASIVTTDVVASTTFDYAYVGDFSTGKTETFITNTRSWFNVWERIYATSSNQAIWRSQTFWLGIIEEEQRQSFTKIAIKFLSNNEGILHSDGSLEQPQGTHCLFEIDDSSSSDTFTDEPYIEIGRVFIGQFVRPKINVEYGNIEHGYIDNSEISASDSGTEYFYEKAKARTVSLQWNFLTEDEALGGIYDAYRSQGITREVLYTYSVDKIDNYQYARSFIGRFNQLNSITQPNVGLYGANVNIKEIL